MQSDWLQAPECFSGNRQTDTNLARCSEVLAHLLTRINTNPVTAFTRCIHATHTSSCTVPCSASATRRLSISSSPSCSGLHPASKVTSFYLT